MSGDEATLDDDMATVRNRKGAEAKTKIQNLNWKAWGRDVEGS
jgi:hypothetical protein